MIQTIHVFKCELLILTLSNSNNSINNNNDNNYMNCAYRGLTQVSHLMFQ